MLLVTVECLTHCSQVQRPAPVAPTPLQVQPTSRVEAIDGCQSMGVREGKKTAPTPGPGSGTVGAPTAGLPPTAGSSPSAGATTANAGPLTDAMEWESGLDKDCPSHSFKAAAITSRNRRPTVAAV